MDTKLDALTRLLKNYDVSKDVCTVLHEYILVGSVEDEPVTSALEQFFSNVQMNDQLIQRLERSLVGAVANVETLARRGLLSPAKSLAYEAGDLQCEPLVDAKSTVDLQRATHMLVLSAEDLVARIVEARFRLRDLVSWLRSIGSQIKARGTAPGSGQRENAKKRRVPHAVTERMASYLQSGGGVVQGDGITESLIGISITVRHLVLVCCMVHGINDLRSNHCFRKEFFSQDRDYMAGTRPGSPKSVDILGSKSIGKMPMLHLRYVLLCFQCSYHYSSQCQNGQQCRLRAGKRARSWTRYLHSQSRLCRAPLLKQVRAFQHTVLYHLIRSSHATFLPEHFVP